MEGVQSHELKTSGADPVNPVEMIPVLPCRSMMNQGGEQQGRGKCLESKVNYQQQKKQLSYIIKEVFILCLLSCCSYVG